MIVIKETDGYIRIIFQSEPGKLSVSKPYVGVNTEVSFQQIIF